MKGNITKAAVEYLIDTGLASIEAEEQVNDTQGACVVTVKVGNVTFSISRTFGDWHYAGSINGSLEDRAYLKTAMELSNEAQLNYPQPKDSRPTLVKSKATDFGIAFAGIAMTRRSITKQSNLVGVTVSYASSEGEAANRHFAKKAYDKIIAAIER